METLTQEKKQTFYKQGETMENVPTGVKNLLNDKNSPEPDEDIETLIDRLPWTDKAARTFAKRLYSKEELSELYRKYAVHNKEKGTKKKVAVNLFAERMTKVFTTLSALERKEKDGEPTLKAHLEKLREHWQNIEAAPPEEQEKIATAKVAIKAHIAEREQQMIRIHRAFYEIKNTLPKEWDRMTAHMDEEDLAHFLPDIDLTLGDEHFAEKIEENSIKLWGESQTEICCRFLNRELARHGESSFTDLRAGKVEAIGSLFRVNLSNLGRVSDKTLSPIENVFGISKAYLVDGTYPILVKPAPPKTLSQRLKEILEEIKGDYHYILNVEKSVGDMLEADFSRTVEEMEENENLILAEHSKNQTDEYLKSICNENEIILQAIQKHIPPQVIEKMVQDKCSLADFWHVSEKLRLQEPPPVLKNEQLALNDELTVSLSE